MKLGLRYQTTYRYEEPVGFSPHHVRLFPRSDRFSRVRRFDFTTAPKGTVRYSRDVFENTVASCFFPERSKELEFRLAINLDLDEKDPFHFILESGAAELPFEYDPAIAPLLEPYRARRTKDRLIVPGWEPPTSRKRQPTVKALVELNKRLHECIGYERREEGAAMSPAETLRRGRGACRDVTVLLAEILRQMGLAARLTSGYLRESDAETRRAEGSLHAWTEVFLPGAGWIGLDATNGVFCNHNFIGAAVGLGPADITPISGIYFHKKRIPAQMTSKLQLINL
ncbi:MAG TPA: transglutaminase family protein [Chthoniobacterales bacterium]|nr:transglutaminase family protein [Chthoniobacterales bacterium]